MARTLPKDMADYLLDLLSPPEPHPRAIFIPDLSQWDLSRIEDACITGVLAVGTPTEEQAEEIMRVLKPGAHMLLVAPEENPIGHHGAVTVEDAGFEIRDTFLVVEEEGDPFHYVPKTSRAERESGCDHLPGKKGSEAVNRKEGSKGAESPRAGASRKAKVVRNHHPTVKPKQVMEKLLGDVPEGVVLDPFMGSGSTGVACLNTHHSFIGIDMTPEYVEIATARLEHWNSQSPNLPAPIESERRYSPPPAENAARDLFDLMFEDK